MKLQFRQSISLELVNERGDSILSFAPVNQAEAVKLFQEGCQDTSMFLKMMSQEDLSDLLEFTLGLLNEDTERQVTVLDDTEYEIGFQVVDSKLQLVSKGEGVIWSCNLLESQLETFQKVTEESKATFGGKVPLVMHEVFDHLTYRQKDSLGSFLYWFTQDLLRKVS
jgi:hypothetical protein